MAIVCKGVKSMLFLFYFIISKGVGSLLLARRWEGLSVSYEINKDHKINNHVLI